MRLIIAGSRTINGPEALDLVRQAVQQSGWRDAVTLVVSGRALGIDMAGVKYAEERDLPVTQFLADWSRYGRSAGPRRNREMACHGDCLVAVWDGKSRGTQNMIEEMRKRSKPVFVLEVPPSNKEVTVG